MNVHLEIFHCGFEEKAQFFSSNPLETQPINTTPLTNKFSLRTKWFKRKVGTMSIRGEVYL